LVELPGPHPEGQDVDKNPRTAMKKDRKDRVASNEGRSRKNAGEEKKKSVVTEVVTRKLAQRLRHSRVGKALGGKAGRRR
jgi:hypothetical protein